MFIRIYVNILYLFIIFLHIDRPWLTEGQKVQKLQEKVYLSLQHSLQKSGASDEKLDKVKTSIHSLTHMSVHTQHKDTDLCLSDAPTDGVQAAHHEVYLQSPH